ncbi:hypothetical protein HPB50_023052 [Hyalomma asiaticum]|uniref:Uncharacterized protein n=1 Tax=Hyalomma asiaticum TaxID=266040 RepID=A0ACB7TT87_HYAAI|nr:hypothetical protein HPB50_023052 [Hyalomma asiaticum]
MKSSFLVHVLLMLPLTKSAVHCALLGSSVSGIQIYDDKMPPRFRAAFVLRVGDTGAPMGPVGGGGRDDPAYAQPHKNQKGSVDTHTLFLFPFCRIKRVPAAVHHAETTHRAGLSQRGPPRRPAKTAAKRRGEERTVFTSGPLARHGERRCQLAATSETARTHAAAAPGWRVLTNYSLDAGSPRATVARTMAAPACLQLSVSVCCAAERREGGLRRRFRLALCAGGGGAPRRIHLLLWRSESSVSWGDER